MSRKRDHSPKKRQTKNRLTSNQREWKHQITNLKRRIKDLEALGVTVDYDIPEMPKTVRKRDIERIKGIKQKQLLKKAFVVSELGEVLKAVLPKIGERGKYREQYKRDRELDRELGKISDDEIYFEPQENQPPSISLVELANLRKMIDELGDPEVISQLNGILDRAIADDGIDNVCYRIEGNFGLLKDAAQQAVKYRGQAKGSGSIAAFARVIYDRTLSFDELVSLESASDYNDDFSLPL